MIKISRRFLTVLLLVSGLMTIGGAIWIPIKARLAQTLLEHAWQRARAGEIEPKPWTWADTWPVGKISFRDHESKLIVLEGASGRTMAFGPGHMHGTPLPGTTGNSVITGHRDTHFQVLKDLRPGDRVDVESVDGSVDEFVVSSTKIVNEREISILRQEGPTRLTLITCYPFDAVRPGGPLRYVVVANAVARTGR